MKSIPRLCFFGLLLTTPSPWLVGCGGSGSPSSGGAPTACSGGSVGSVPVNQLSAAQQTAVCSDVESCGMSFASSVEGPLAELFCRLSGAEVAILSGATTDAQLQQACQQVYTACIQGQDGGTPTTTTDQCIIPTIAATCTATVNQVFACLNDEVTAETNAVNTALQSIPPCASLTVASLPGIEDAGAAPLPSSQVSAATIPSCQAIQTTCPGALGTSSADAGTLGP